GRGPMKKRRLVHGIAPIVERKQPLPMLDHLLNKDCLDRFIASTHIRRAKPIDRKKCDQPCNRTDRCQFSEMTRALHKVAAIRHHGRKPGPAAGPARRRSSIRPPPLKLVGPLSNTITKCARKFSGWRSYERCEHSR